MSKIVWRLPVCAWLISLNIVISLLLQRTGFHLDMTKQYYVLYTYHSHRSDFWSWLFMFQCLGWEGFKAYVALCALGITGFSCSDGSCHFHQKFLICVLLEIRTEKNLFIKGKWQLRAVHDKKYMNAYSRDVWTCARLSCLSWSFFQCGLRPSEEIRAGPLNQCGLCLYKEIRVNPGLRVPCVFIRKVKQFLI